MRKGILISGPHTETLGFKKGPVASEEENMADAAQGTDQSIISNRLGTIAVSDLGNLRPDWNGERLIPKRVVVETVFGCNARCGMCVIDQPTDRPKGVMTMEMFTSIIDRLEPYKDNIEIFDLFGLGEPLLDPLLFDRIRYARSKGFRRLGFATNGHLLTPDKQKAILESGIDTVIFSLDGITKVTLEGIRPRVSFERVMAQCPEIVLRRNEGGYRTRFVVRFTRQQVNAHEWEPFREFWSKVLDPERGDVVYSYNVHTWSGQVDDTSLPDQRPDRIDRIEQQACHHAFEKLVILANGAVALCFEDILEAQFRFGNVGEQDPIDVFNSPGFNKIRRLHLDGKKANLKICGNCRVLYNELGREVG
jgi:radical SAM protein with 4Fe4S-binding SPASM domain